MSYYNDCLNLEIARHTTLSDAEYLSLNLFWRAEICSSIVHMPKYLQMSLYVSLDKAPNILKRALYSAYKSKESLGA